MAPSANASVLPSMFGTIAMFEVMAPPTAFSVEVVRQFRYRRNDFELSQKLSNHQEVAPPCDR